VRPAIVAPCGLSSYGYARSRSMTLLPMPTAATAPEADALPACLRRVPIAVKDRATLEKHVGRIVYEVDAGQALVVEPWEKKPRRTNGSPFWQEHPLDELFPLLQIWVAPAFESYRAAWERTMGALKGRDEVLDHLYNRKYAIKEAHYGFLRLHPVERGVNTSGGRGIEHTMKAYAEHAAEHGVAIPCEPVEYAGVFELAKMWGIRPGESGFHGPPEGLVALQHAIRENFAEACFKTRFCKGAV